MKINDNQTGRDLMKNFGETMKILHGQDYWSIKWHKKVYLHIIKWYKNFVVSDVRFESDFKYIKNFKKRGELGSIW